MSEILKYDDASWHSEGDFPKDLPDEAGATHIGMYLAWAVTRRLASDELEDQKLVLERKITPGQFLLQTCDGKLLREDLSDAGNRFSVWYYGDEDVLYYNDLIVEFPTSEFSSLYYVPDSWDSFDRISRLIDARFETFKP